MGLKVSKFLKENTLDDSQKEQLEFLQKAAQSKLAVYKSSINEMFLNPKAAESIQVVGKRAVDMQEYYTVNFKSEPDNAITEAINTFFPKEKNKENEQNEKKSTVVDGFKTVVTASINSILGNTIAGEQEDSKYFIFFENNALIRIDLRMWRYNFTSNGIIAKSENAFCYIISKSVVDHKKVTIDELVYFISEQAGNDRKEVKAYIDEISEVYKVTSELSSKHVVGSVPDGDKIV